MRWEESPYHLKRWGKNRGDRHRRDELEVIQGRAEKGHKSSSIDGTERESGLGGNTR